MDDGLRELTNTYYLQNGWRHENQQYIYLSRWGDPIILDYLHL